MPVDESRCAVGGHTSYRDRVPLRRFGLLVSRCTECGVPLYAKFGHRWRTWTICIGEEPDPRQ